MEKERLSV